MSEPPTKQAWTALVALAAGAFLFVTTEALPMGMLAQFAAGLRVSERTAGLLVTGYAFCVALTAVPLTAALARVNRRVLLSGLLVTLCVGAAVSALAPGYAVLLGARIVVAAAQGSSGPCRRRRPSPWSGRTAPVAGSGLSSEGSRWPRSWGYRSSPS